MSVDTKTSGALATTDQIAAASPALAARTRDRLFGTVWERPGLSRRDRSLISIAALIARGQTGALGGYGARALDEGVTPAELSETILHLAYYSGWGNAVAATAPVAALFAERGIAAEALPAVEQDEPLPLDEEAEATRRRNVGEQFGAVAPGLVDYTTDYLFRELWLRAGLAPRDRSLVTVAALVAANQPAQVTFHLGRAMDNGLSQEEAAEVVTHLAFYAGWPNAMSALPVFKDVFAKRKG
jgi:4-carboxymuconolactone decarboxylase